MTGAPPPGDREGWDLSTAVILFHDELARRLGISASDHKAFGLVRRSGPMPIGELAARLGVVSSAATAIVDRLERAGLVERAAEPADRRRVLVRATAATPAAEADAYRRMGEATAAFMTGLGDEARSAVLDYIRLTIRLLHEETERLRG